jgi:hypothetical protein
MAESDDRNDPVEALLDLLIYAPLGLVTQLDELLPGLIERGRSQAVMARTIGEFAVRAGTTKVQGKAEETQRTLEEAARSLLTLVAALTDRSDSPSAPAQDADPAPAQEEGMGDHAFPIEGYDALKATEIIPLLEGLDPAQRAEVEERERSGRSRKTILNRLSQLAATD